MTASVIVSTLTINIGVDLTKRLNFLEINSIVLLVNVY